VIAVGFLQLAAHPLAPRRRASRTVAPLQTGRQETGS
jgi:hypothetical protein